jgi:hypothetical protein
MESNSAVVNNEVIEHTEVVLWLLDAAGSGGLLSNERPRLRCDKQIIVCSEPGAIHQRPFRVSTERESASPAVHRCTAPDLETLSRQHILEVEGEAGRENDNS